MKRGLDLMLATYQIIMGKKIDLFKKIFFEVVDLFRVEHQLSTVRRM